MHSCAPYDASKQPRRLARLPSYENAYTCANTDETNFSRLSGIRLNKNKKHMLEQRRNTEIDRINRLLYEKIAKCANRPLLMDSKPTKNRKHRYKLNTLPHSPAQRSLSPANQHQMRSNILLHNKKKDETNTSHKNATKVRTLFMGHSWIDGIEFKIKLMIAHCMYYLVAENQYSKIVLQMPEEQYWELHYKELQENPCNIFKYLQIKKGRIQFRVCTPRDGPKQKAARVKSKQRTSDASGRDETQKISELRLKKSAKLKKDNAGKSVCLPKI